MSSREEEPWLITTGKFRSRIDRWSDTFIEDLLERWERRSLKLRLDSVEDMSENVERFLLSTVLWFCWRLLSSCLELPFSVRGLTKSYLIEYRCVHLRYWIMLLQTPLVHHTSFSSPRRLVEVNLPVDWFDASLRIRMVLDFVQHVLTWQDCLIRLSARTLDDRADLDLGGSRHCGEPEDIQRSWISFNSEHVFAARQTWRLLDSV